MPVIINEIVITTNIEKKESPVKHSAPESNKLSMDDIVKQTVEKVMEILEERKQR